MRSNAQASARCFQWPCVVWGWSAWSWAVAMGKMSTSCALMSPMSWRLWCWESPLPWLPLEWCSGVLAWQRLRHESACVWTRLGYCSLSMTAATALKTPFFVGSVPSWGVAWAKVRAGGWRQIVIFWPISLREIRGEKWPERQASSIKEKVIRSLGEDKCALHSDKMQKLFIKENQSWWHRE